jgi:hypothetical protein
MSDPYTDSEVNVPKDSEETYDKVDNSEFEGIWCCNL